MADDDAEQPRPSLEPPKLFRRRGRKPAPTPEPAVEPEAELEPGPEAGPEAEEDSATAAPVTPTVEAGTDDQPDEHADDAVADPADQPADQPADEPEAEVAPIPVVVDEPEPVAATTTDPVEDEHTVEHDDEHDDEPGFTDAATVPVHVGGDHDERAPDPRPDDVPDTTDTAGTTAVEEREPRGPLLVGRNAALVTGLLVGVLLVLLASGGSATCTAIRGTSACGAALGFPVIVVILALATVAGALLLRLFRLPAPASTSFMAVALLGVVTGLFLGDSLDSWVVRLAYPLGSALAFLAAWWLTVSFDDPEVVRLARQEREQEVA